MRVNGFGKCKATSQSCENKKRLLLNVSKSQNVQKESRFVNRIIIHEFSAWEVPVA